MMKRLNVERQCLKAGSRGMRKQLSVFVVVQEVQHG